MEILCLTEEVKDRRKEIEITLNLVELMENEIQISSIHHKDEINASIDRIKRETERQIEEYRNSLLKQFEESTQQKLNLLAQQSKQLERDVDCLENCVSFSRSFVRNSTDDQFDFYSPLISDQLKRLNSDQTFVHPPVVLNQLESVISLYHTQNEGKEKKEKKKKKEGKKEEKNQKYCLIFRLFSKIKSE